MKTSSSKLVSVILAARDAEGFLKLALESVLRQTLRELELIVVDDGSRDQTPQILEQVRDPRLTVIRNEEPKGLAFSLNRGLESAGGRFVARMDADDVALPARLERQLALLRSRESLGIVGSGVTEIDGRGRVGRTHVLPAGIAATRWRSRFGTPFYHPTVIFDRELLDRHELRYDSSYDGGDASTEDFELWTRLLAVSDGDNVVEPLLLYRLHKQQASERLHDHQLELRQRIALKQIASICPELDPGAAKLAWLVGDGRDVPSESAEEAVAALLTLHTAFYRRYANLRRVELKAVREQTAIAIARLALGADSSSRSRLLRRALKLDKALPLHTASRRSRRRSLAREMRRVAPPWLRSLESGSGGRGPRVRFVGVFPEPAPYRSPMFDRMAARDDLHFTILYAGETIAGRTWTVEQNHPYTFLRGVTVPGLRWAFHHDYRITPGIWKALEEESPDCVVISGWSTFTAQEALFWCRVRRVPYVLYVESHDAGPRAGWRRAVKNAVVPRFLGSAASILVTGSVTREAMIARGFSPERIRVFADTIDVEAWAERAGRLAGRRDTLRDSLGAGEDDVLVLSVARLAPEKGLDTLIRAVASTGDPKLLLVVVGEGAERQRLDELANELGVRLVLCGDQGWQNVLKAYVAADIFALLSEREPWGVVVNEAAACGLPLVLSDRVGAATDLVRDGENGALVPAGDVPAAAAALKRLADDPAARRRAGERSRELIAGWGYEPSIENFVAAVREAAAERPA